MKELVSIVMTTYNGERYLKEQLDSIFSQTYSNLEIIVVDDVSSDSTVRILEEYRKQYGLKYFINEQNLGVTKNFEKAISLCKGEYIALVDQDDVWLPKKIETLCNNIGDASLIYSNGGIINKDSKIQEKSTEALYPLLGLDTSSKDIYNYLVLNSFILGCSTMFKRELLSDLIPIYQSSRNHDWWLAMCAYKNNGIKYIDEILFYYRHHDTNYSRNGKNTSPFQKFSTFYSKKRNFDRRERIIEQCNIVQHLLAGNVLSSTEKSFLDDMQLFCGSFLKTKIHFKAFIISLKYEKYMFLNKNRFENILHMFSRLIG